MDTNVREFKATTFLTIVKYLLYNSAESRSGLLLLPWPCYASVIQCDIIQNLMFLLFHNTEIICFLAIYNDTILYAIFYVRERLYAKNTAFFTCFDVALFWEVFCKHVYFNVHEEDMLHMALEVRRNMFPVTYFLRL